MSDSTRALTNRHHHTPIRRKGYIRGRKMVGGCLLAVAPFSWLFPQLVSGLEPSLHLSSSSEWNNQPIEWWDSRTTRNRRRLQQRTALEEVVCQESEVCTLCTATDKELIAECAKTGKIKTLSCRKRGDDADSDTDSEDETDEQSSSRKTVYQSCKRTVEDEQFLMLQWQVLWLLTGVFAFASVRKQKILNASLFDQRKDRRKKRSTSDHGVELAPKSRIGNEETIPLTSNENNNLDIV